MPITTLHTLPLRLKVSPDGGLEWLCDLPGFKFVRTGADFHLTLPTDGPYGLTDRYRYMVPDPETTAEAWYYATIFSGRPLEKKTRWAREGEANTSPIFEVSSGEHVMTIIATVAAEPRPGARSGAGPTTLSSPIPVYSAKSHGKTDGVGGGDDVVG